MERPDAIAGAQNLPENLPENLNTMAPVQVRALQAARKLETRENRLAGLIETTAKRLDLHRNVRLTIGLTASVLLFIVAIPPVSAALFGKVPLPAVILLFLLLATFVVFVARTRRLQGHLTRLTRLKLFFERQRRRCLGQAISGSTWEDALKAAQSLPSFQALPRDLGLIGPHSLWTLLDETMTDGGRLRLLEWLAHSKANVDDIRKRQKLVQDLSRESWFFSRWGLNSTAAETRLACSQILLFVKDSFVQKSFRWWLIANWAIWFITIGLIVYGGTHNNSWGLAPLALFSAMSLLTFSAVESPYSKAVGLSHHLGELAPVFEALEKRTKSSAAIERLAPVTGASGPSLQARKLNRVLAFMSTEANPLLHFLIKISLPWTITAIYFLERRRRKIAYTFPQCLEELSELEAIGSLVLLTHYQTNVFPEVIAPHPRPTLSFKSLFHPLLDRAKAVGNDFAFPSAKNLGLLTGSNMAGKSTFLRTIGVNQILANMGAPVFAISMSTSPVQLETCIEVSDSLRDGISYFYAEVRKLKSLLDAGTSGRHVLFLIDEIFRGTNNRERHIGSRAVIRTLAQAPHALGFVSTHDLELTHLEERLPSVVNLHFREEISDAGEMEFSYLLHFGPCPTTNALKIMAKEGIAVYEGEV